MLLVKILARQVNKKAAIIGKFSSNYNAEYSLGSFRSTDIMHIDEMVDLIYMILSKVNNCVLSAVGLFDTIFIQIHKMLTVKVKSI
jgi:hypothetical protein